MASILKRFGLLFKRLAERSSSESGYYQQASAGAVTQDTTWDDIKHNRQAWKAKMRDYLRRMERDQEMITSACAKAGVVFRDAANSYLAYLKRTHLETKLRDLITWRNIDKESRKTKVKLDEANKLNPDTSYYDRKIAEYNFQIDEIKRQLGLGK